MARRREGADGRRRVSSQVDHPDQCLEARMAAQRFQQERSADTIRGTRPLVHRMLKVVKRLLVVAETDVHERQVVGRDERRLGQFLESAENLPRLLGSAGEAVRLTEPRLQSWTMMIQSSHARR